jgi:uncharacterized protein (TIGR02246 family)
MSHDPAIRISPIRSVLFSAFALWTCPALAGDDEDIKAVFAAVDAAWAAGDVKAIVAVHTDDALVVNPAGITARGKAEQEAALGTLTVGPGKSKPTTTVKSIRYPAKDVAVVDSEIAGQGKPAKRLSVLVKKGGKWMVSDSRAYFVVAPLSDAAATSGPAARPPK